MRTEHIEGLVEKRGDGLTIKWDLIADLFADAIDTGKSKFQKDDYQTNRSVYAPNVFLQVYVCNEKCSLDEAKTNMVLSLYGDIDVLTNWYGYSEYTIEGFDIENFTIGGHNLEKEFESLVGKYAHFVLEIKDQPTNY